MKAQVYAFVFEHTWECGAACFVVGFLAAFLLGGGHL